jgi:hypothetical protein
MTDVDDLLARGIASGSLSNVLRHADLLAQSATELRNAQREYMADRGNDAKGRAVAQAAAFVDLTLARFAKARSEL